MELKRILLLLLSLVLLLPGTETLSQENQQAASGSGSVGEGSTVKERVKKPKKKTKMRRRKKQRTRKKSRSAKNHLTIWIREKKDPGDWGFSELKRTSAAWTKTCVSIGKSLLAGKGPWGTGFFSGFSCFHDKRLILGKDRAVDWSYNIHLSGTKVLIQVARGGVLMDDRMVAEAETGPKKKSGDAQDQESPFEEDDDLQQVEQAENKKPGPDQKVAVDDLKEVGEGFPMSDVFKLSLQKAEYAPWVLFDEHIRTYLALGISDEMPAAMALPRRSVDWKSGTVNLSKLALPNVPKIMPPYEAAVIYHLDYDMEQGLWRPTVISYAKRAKMKTKEPARVLYRLAKVRPEKISRSKMVYLHNFGGPGRRHDHYQKQISERIAVVEKNPPGSGVFAQAGQVVLDSLVDTLAAGYVGFRYGHPMVSGKEFISKAQMYGILGQVRSGPLAGLRIYFDLIPEVEEDIGGEKYKYGWNRTTLGWSFGYNLGFVFDRIDFTPKLGVWNIDAELPVSSGSNVFTKVPVKIDYGLAVGGEIGAEMVWSWAMFRLWGSSELGISLTGGSSSSVTSTRGGLDTWIEGPGIGGPFHVSFLLFSAYESVTVKKDTTTENIPLELSFSQIYTGAGLSLSW